MTHRAEPWGPSESAAAPPATPARSTSDRLPVHVLGSLLRCLVRDDAPEQAEVLAAIDLALGRIVSGVRADVTLLAEVDQSSDQVSVLAARASPEREDVAARLGVLLEQPPRGRGCWGFLASEVWLRGPYIIEAVPADLPQPGPLVEVLGGPVASVVGASEACGPMKQALLLAAHGRPGSAGGFGAADRRLLADVIEVVARLLRRCASGAGPLDADERALSLGLLSGCPALVEREGIELPLGLLQSIGERVLRRYRVLPLASRAPGELQVAVADPLDWSGLSDFEAVSGYRITEKLVAPAAWIEQRLTEAFAGMRAEAGEQGLEQSGDGHVGHLAEHLRELYEVSQGMGPDVPSGEGRPEEVTEHSPPVVRLANQLIVEAHRMRASDIHLEAQEHALVVRYRIDGTCRERLRLPLLVARPLVSRLKIMSRLDIAEHRLPQDGRIRFADFDPRVDVDLRVSVLPMLHGEGVCLRLLDKHRAMLPLDQLGFSAYNLHLYREIISAPYGMMLHCGPTGSGKSMTLYAALNELNDPQLKILTAEDPVEYTLAGINQLQVHSAIGLTFAAALRCFLRHDPDIVLVGEIRDPETARIAVEASLTGHLLLSTLHTNDAASAIPRLSKLEVEPFLVGATLIGLCAQRLVRRLCLECRRAVEPSAEELSHLRKAKDGQPPEHIYAAVGCQKCQDVGYAGRTGVHELMAVGGRLRQLIMDGASGDDLKQAARRQGMRTMFEDCMAKVRDGTTSLEEAFRVTRPDEVT